MKNQYRVLAAFAMLFFQMHSIAATLNVKDFGAKGNGVADDTKAIQAAINAAPVTSMSTIYFPAGVYSIASYTATRNYLENYCLLLHANLTIKGEGDKTIIRLADHQFDKPDTPANAHIFFGVKISNIHFTDLMIDMNGSNNLVPQNFIKNHTAIFLYMGTNISIKKATVKNCAGCNMVVIKGNGSKALIEDCKFYNGGNYVGSTRPNKHQFDFSFLYSEWDSTTIQNNILLQQNIDIALDNYTGGIELHGSYSCASGNSITGCWPAVYISSSWHPMEKTTVENNQMKNCIKGVSFWIIHPMNNITIRNNNIQLTHTRLLKPRLSPGIEMPNGNMTDFSAKNANNAAVTNLLITDNKISSTLPDTAKERTVGMVLHSLQKGIIKNNTITGMNYAGIMLQGSKWGMESLSVTDNSFINFKTNNDAQAVAGYVVVTDSYGPSNKNAPGFKQVSFSNNKFIRNGAQQKPANDAVAKGKFLGAFVALPAAMLTQIKFTNNTFSDASEKVVAVKTD